MDAQGRILFSPELRRELGIENQPVRLFAYRGRIEVLTEAIYEERKREASEMSPDELSTLEAAGLN
jgi:DNA-binding transcriptional regulator/RsmH inhibitor MraZ